MNVGTLRLYRRYVSLAVRAQLAYRASFAMRSLSQLLATGLEFLALASLFARFGHIRGWTLAEMGLFYGIISAAFAIAETAARGFDEFSALVKSGDFDRVLLRPRSPELQVVAPHVQVRLGRLAQGLFVLVWAASRLGLGSASDVVVIAAAIAGGACLFSGLFVLQATACFWTVESLEVFNATTYGGVEAAQFPLDVYRPWFRAFFTFVIPLATVNYFPAHALLGRTDPLGSTRLFQLASPLAGVVFLLLSLALFRLGVRRYTSTGS